MTNEANERATDGGGKNDPVHAAESDRTRGYQTGGGREPQSPKHDKPGERERESSGTRPGERESDRDIDRDSASRDNRGAPKAERK